MRLAKLELYGFKSFAKKTEIIFSDGITAVVGPNGSGKSNISDAIKWVLGEQSAKALRGGKMQDVIFSGTQQRKAQAYCEVTLTFDNSDGKLAVPFTEIAVTRRVYRSGESEYCINGNACRLKDIQDMFRDTGIGKDGYSIIGQGRVDEILSNKSSERRAALEEAAGVMRYRVRKEEAERKLEHTGKNLERIEDILNELGDRLGPLEEQSASARAYLKLRDELKDNEVNLFLYQYERNQERLTAVCQAIEQLTKEGALFQASESELLLACAGLEEQVRTLDAQLSERQNHLMVLLSGVETHVGEANVLLERKEHANQECIRIQGEMEQTKNRMGELSKALSEMDTADAQSAALHMLDTDMEASEQGLAELDRRIAADEEALEAMKASIIEAMNRLSDYRSDISRFDAMKAAIENRLAALSAEEERCDSEDTKRTSEQEEAMDLTNQGQDAVNDAQKDLDEAIAHRNTVQETFVTLQQEIQQDEQHLSSTESRLRVLNEMAKSREGYYVSVKNIMRDAQHDPRLSRAIVGVVAELIRVPKQYETAITMALGASLQNIVTPTAEDAKYVIDTLRSRDYGRATLLPMALLHPEGLRNNERELLSMSGVLGVGSELVECDQNMDTVVNYLLGRTVVVDNLESGIALKKRSRGAFHIATLEGDIISTGGSMSGGSMQKNRYSLLGREREIKELTASLAGVEKGLEEKKDKLRRTERELLQCDLQVDAFRNVLHSSEVELAKRGEQLDIIRRDGEKVQQRRDQLAQERAQLMENLNDIALEREQCLTAQTDAEQGNAVTQEDVLTAQGALAELRQQREQASLALTEQKVRRMALVKERDAIFGERKRLEAEQVSSQQRLKALEAQQTDNLAQIQEVEARLAQMQAGIVGEQATVEAEKQAQRKLEEEREQADAALREQRARREELVAQSRSLSDRLHKQELQKSRLEMEQTTIQDHIWEEYELTYDNALPLRREIAVTATSSRINEIKSEIRELGDINLSAIEDYKAVFERHSQLLIQCDDLNSAKADLETLIAQLTDTMEDVFIQQFTRIQENFTGVFSELFGGGHAEMRLGDMHDVLNCDIDIIAQPPGKKLQLLSLLSGGERALTAIALLFAMLQLKPPAFCLLDEIESSLDEVNVSRFADYLKHYSDDTQFILITHRKGSMEVCDSLYGVSMEERGISKIVSTKFGEAV